MSPSEGGTAARTSRHSAQHSENAWDKDDPRVAPCLPDEPSPFLSKFLCSPCRLLPAVFDFIDRTPRNAALDFRQRFGVRAKSIVRTESHSVVKRRSSSDLFGVSLVSGFCSLRAHRHV